MSGTMPSQFCSIQSVRMGLLASNRRQHGGLHAVSLHSQTVGAKPLAQVYLNSWNANSSPALHAHRGPTPLTDISNAPRISSSSPFNAQRICVLDSALFKIPKVRISMSRGPPATPYIHAALSHCTSASRMHTSSHAAPPLRRCMLSSHEKCAIYKLQR